MEIQDLDVAIAKAGLHPCPKIRQENSFLMRLLMRNLKASAIVVVEKNANNILFEHGQADQAVPVISGEVPSAAIRLKNPFRQVLGGKFKSAAGVTMELKVGKLYTLLLFSKNAGGFSPAQVDLMAEVGRCLEDRYQLRREADTRNTLANLSTCSVLLSAIKPYLSATQHCANKIGNFLTEYGRNAYLQHLTEVSQLFPSFNSLCSSLHEVMERTICVASYYTTSNHIDYFVSTFQTQSQGISQVLNAILLRLNQLMPSHNLLWSFELDSLFSNCAHRTYYAHLLFFLEGLVFRWAPHCTTAQIVVSFEPSGLVDYYTPPSSPPTRSALNTEHADDIAITTSAEIVDVASKTNTERLGNEWVTSWAASRSQDECDSSKLGWLGGSGRVDTTLTVPTSASSAEANRCIRHGYLRVSFQPLDADDLPSIEETEKLWMSPQQRQQVRKPKTALALRNSKLVDRGAYLRASLGRGRSAAKFFDASLSPRVTSVALLAVLNDFLKDLDPKATAGVGMTCNVSLGDFGEAFELNLPTCFTLPMSSQEFHEQSKQRVTQRSPRTRSAVAKSVTGLQAAEPAVELSQATARRAEQSKASSPTSIASSSATRPDQEKQRAKKQPRRSRPTSRLPSMYVFSSTAVATAVQSISRAAANVLGRFTGATSTSNEGGSSNPKPQRVSKKQVLPWTPNDSDEWAAQFP